MAPYPGSLPGARPARSRSVVIERGWLGRRKINDNRPANQLALVIRLDDHIGDEVPLFPRLHLYAIDHADMASCCFVQEPKDARPVACEKQFDTPMSGSRKVKKVAGVRRRLEYPTLSVGPEHHGGGLIAQFASLHSGSERLAFPDMKEPVVDAQVHDHLLRLAPSRVDAGVVQVHGGAALGTRHVRRKCHLGADC